MPAPFSATELSRMRTAWDISLVDSCKIGARTATANTYGEMIETYTYGDETDCAIEYTHSAEVQRGEGTILAIDARLRLAYGSTITHRDRVQLTYRAGTALGTAQTFEVVGYPHLYVAA